MKKSLFVLTAALSFGFAAAQTAAPVAPATPAAAPAVAPQVPALTDVPAGHWAKDAIDRLVERGIILGYPDGTYRGTQNLTRYEAAVIIARLLDQIRVGTVSQDSLSAEDLTALQNAIQELAADLTALGVRVSDLEENAVGRDDFSRLEARVEELAAANGDAAAITAIQTQIAELTARADEYDTLRADIDDNASSIAALNDLTVLLNQDILNLQDRVSAVESAQADFVQRSDFDNLAGRVGTIDTRVTTLENAPRFSVTGGLTSGFGSLRRTDGPDDFDVDRLTNGTFGANVFSNPTTTAGSVSSLDTLAANGFSNAGGLTFGVRASNLRTANGLVVANNAALNFGIVDVNVANSTSIVPVVTLTDANVDGTINGQKFTARYNFRSSAFKFSDYLFNETAGLAGRGLVATVEATTLPLQPTITVVTGRTTSVGATGGAPSVDYYGVRASVKPSTVSTVGVSYAQANRTAFGVDYNATFGIVKVKGEGVISAPNTLENNFLAGNAQGFFQNSDKAFYTNVTADLGIVDFGVNYRTIDPDFAVTNAAGSVIPNAGMSVSNTLPYSADQTGFGAALGTNFGPIALGAYADSYTPYGGGDRTTGFGVKAGAMLGALEVVGFFNRVTVGNALDGNFSSDLNIGNAGMDIADVPYAMTSTVGAEVSHDGAATNALVRNLNFTVGNAYYYGDPLNNFYAYADYSATVAGITLQPLVRYNLVTDRNFVNDEDGNPVNESENTLKYGIKLSTATLTGLPLQPSLYANFANRISNDGSAVSIGNGTTTELLGQVGVSFNQFLAPSATAKIGYSYYQGFGVNSGSVAAGANVGNTNQAFNAADDRIYSGRGAQNGKVQGVYAQVGFSGLAANYGVFRYTNLNTNTTSTAQGFRVSYNFNF